MEKKLPSPGAVVSDASLNIGRFLRVFHFACSPEKELPGGPEFSEELGQIVVALFFSYEYFGNLRKQLPALFEQHVELEQASKAIRHFAAAVRRIVPSLSEFQVLCLLDMILDFLEGNEEHLDIGFRRGYGFKVSATKICQAFGRKWDDENERWARSLIAEVYQNAPSRETARAVREIVDMPCTSIFISASSGADDEEFEDNGPDGEE